MYSASRCLKITPINVCCICVGGSVAVCQVAYESTIKGTQNFECTDNKPNDWMFQNPWKKHISQRMWMFLIFQHHGERQTVWLALCPVLYPLIQRFSTTFSITKKFKQITTDEHYFSAFLFYSNWLFGLTTRYTKETVDIFPVGGSQSSTNTGGCWEANK